MLRAMRYLAFFLLLIALPASAEWVFQKKTDKMDEEISTTTYLFKDGNNTTLGGFIFRKKSNLRNPILFTVILPSVNGCFSKSCNGRIKIGESKPRNIDFYSSTTSKSVMIVDPQIIREIIEAFENGERIMIGAPLYRKGEYIAEFLPEGFDKELLQ